MTIFDILNDILFTKKGKLLQNVDDEAAFNNYMINRWISMYSPNLAIVINSTTNWLYSVFETKQDYYKFINKVIPKVQRKHIAYIKKKKPEETEETENLKLIAKRLELSEREIKSYYEFSSRQGHCTTSTDPLTG
jgi:hypothetical protein